MQNEKVFNINFGAIRFVPTNTRRVSQNMEKQFYYKYSNNPKFCFQSELIEKS